MHFLAIIIFPPGNYCREIRPMIFTLRGHARPTTRIARRPPAAGCRLGGAVGAARRVRPGPVARASRSWWLPRRPRCPARLPNCEKRRLQSKCGIRRERKLDLSSAIYIGVVGLHLYARADYIWFAECKQVIHEDTCLPEWTKQGSGSEVETGWFCAGVECLYVGVRKCPATDHPLSGEPMQWCPGGCLTRLKDGWVCGMLVSWDRAEGVGDGGAIGVGESWRGVACVCGCLVGLSSAIISEMGVGETASRGSDLGGWYAFSMCADAQKKQSGEH